MQNIEMKSVRINLFIRKIFILEGIVENDNIRFKNRY